MSNIRYEIRSTITFGSGQLTRGEIFNSPGAIIEHVNSLISTSKHVPGSSREPITLDHVKRWIKKDHIIARQTGAMGTIEPITTPSIQKTPPTLNNTTFDRAKDQEIADSGKTLGYQNDTHTKLGYHPENLKGKSLDELNGLVADQFPQIIQDRGAFASEAEAVSFLTANYKPSA